MRFFFIIIFPFLIFQPFTKADDIRDFEIDGMSIGDSLLDHLSKKQIKKNEIDYYIDDEFINDGLFDDSKARPLVRLGYMNYGVVGEENTFAKNRPQLDENGNLKEVKEWDGIYR